MAPTYKSFVCQYPKVPGAIIASKRTLGQLGFRTREVPGGLVCTRGGFWSAPQRFVLNFVQVATEQVRIDGQFSVMALYLFHQTVDDNAINGFIPRRIGYTLMQKYIQAMGGTEVEPPAGSSRV